MPKRFIYGLGRCLAGVLVFATFVVALWRPLEQEPSAASVVQILAVQLGFWAGIVVHEFGHLLAGVAMGADIRAFRLGGPNRGLKFRLRGVYVSLGFPYRGEVEYAGTLSAGRRVVITVAGSAADMVAGALLIGLANLLPTGQSVQEEVFALGLGIGATGLTNLMPYRTRKGRLTDGARLPELRRDATTAAQHRLLLAATGLQRTGRAAALLKLHAKQDIPSGPLSAHQARLLGQVEHLVACLPVLPADTIALIERRLEVLLPFMRGGPGEALAYFTLACLRLKEQRFGEVEALSQRALAVASACPPQDTSPHEAAAALTCVARQALGLPFDDVLASAVAPRPEIGKRMAGLWWVTDPEGMYAAFQEGDLLARVGAGGMAMYLRRGGQVEELLELHAGITDASDERTADPPAPALLESINDVEYNVLLLPGIPDSIMDVAAGRLHFVQAHHPSLDERYRAAVEHTLALISLRQGRYKEVEPLCRAGLEADLPPHDRATVLATVALARQARGKSCRGLLTEAVFLAPDADLVHEASQASPAPAAHGAAGDRRQAQRALCSWKGDERGGLGAGPSGMV